MLLLLEATLPLEHSKDHLEIDNGQFRLLPRSLSRYESWLHPTLRIHPQIEVHWVLGAELFEAVADGLTSSERPSRIIPLGDLVGDDGLRDVSQLA